MKNILVFGSPRSGTHALGSHLAKEKKIEYLGEICLADGKTDPVQDVERILYNPNPCVAQIVQASSKIALSGMVSKIKQHCEVIALRRRNKLQQFASWMYFHQSGGVNNDWHNHTGEIMLISQNQICATEDQINQFLLEQMLDDFFNPDQLLYLEDIDVSNSTIKQNRYAWDLPLIFSNLDVVKAKLYHWCYHEKHI